MSTLTIAHLYPQEMNTYGDSGNIIALKKRLQWRGYQVEVVDVHPGRAIDFHQTDIVFGGGGQDSGQLRIADDLAERGEELKSAAADGLPMLMVCGLYQLFGVGFLTDTDRYINGIGVPIDTMPMSASSRTTAINAAAIIADPRPGFWLVRLGSS
jgi:CobQ-like glutamine amidotransferase family enzyme